MDGAPYKFDKEGGGAGHSFAFIITTKERPCHVYSDSMPSKQIIGQTIMYNGNTSCFEVESWWRTTLWTAPCHREHGWCSSQCAPSTALAMSIYANFKMPCSNFQWSITQCFLPQICIAFEAVLFKLHVKLAPGWALIWVKFDPV